MNIIIFTQKYFQNKIKLLIYIVLSVGLGVIPLVSNYILGNIIDKINNIVNIKEIYYLLLIYFTSLIITIIIRFINGLLYNKLQVSASYKMNEFVLEHVKRLPIKFLKDIDLIYLNQRINNDVNNLTIFFIGLLSDIITNIFTVLFMFYIMFSINKSIICIFIIITILYTLLYNIMKKRIFSCNITFQERQSEYFSRLNEQIYNIKFIKTHVLFEVLRKRLKITFDSLLLSIMKMTKNKLVFSSVESTITSIAQVIFIFVIAIAVIEGKITIGLFSILISYFSTLINSLKYFIGVGENYQENLGSFNRLIDLINISKENNGELRISKFNSIEIKNLNFLYNESYVFKNFNYRFEKGKVYCIVGRNGSGKSTLLNLINGLYIDDLVGAINYDNISIKDLDMYYMRQNIIGVTEQEPLLLKGTIKDNLILNNNNVDFELLENLIDCFGIRNIIDNVLDEKNSTVSGGEKQKISLIRLLLKQPQILILDEPTSALDKDSIEEFKKIVISLKLEKIIIIVTHDKEIIDISDEVLSL